MDDATVARGVPYAVDVTDDSGNAGKSSTASRNDADVLVGVLAPLALAVGVVVEVCDGVAQLLDTGGGRVLEGLKRQIDRVRARGSVGDVANLWRALN